MDEVKEMSVEKPSKRVRALSIVSYVLLTLAIILCVVVVFQVITQGYVQIFGYSLFRVVTPSMEPELPVGVFIISQKVNIQDINEGDIVSFSSLESYMKGSIVTHRVIDIKDINGKISLVTRGDANNSVDGYYVTEDNLVGRVVYNTKEDNFFVRAYKFITQKHIFFLIIILPMLITAVCMLRGGIVRMSDEIKNIKDEIKRQEAEKLSGDDGNDPSDKNT